MRGVALAELCGSQPTVLPIGGVIASREPAVLRTLLGSCVAVCLRDPVAQVGGMNHYMLPAGRPGEDDSTLYGKRAMEILVAECVRSGADRKRLEAKVFGGGHVLRVRETDGNVPQRNVEFALDYLAREDIEIVAQDIGGYAAREIYFFTDSGRLLLKRLISTGSAGRETLANVEREERDALGHMSRTNKLAIDGNLSWY